eukprot:253262-Amphidinium_carterae.1
MYDQNNPDQRDDDPNSEDPKSMTPTLGYRRTGAKGRQGRQTREARDAGDARDLKLKIQSFSRKFELKTFAKLTIVAAKNA